MQIIEPINLMEKFAMFGQLWTPHIVGELNGHYLKICKIKGDFVWHSHDNEDELFMVLKGTLYSRRMLSRRSKWVRRGIRMAMSHGRMACTASPSAAR